MDRLDLKYVTTQACIIDFGESYEISTPPESLGIPLGYRAPKLFFDGKCGIAPDLWALACTIYELRSKRVLFENWDNEDDMVLLQIVRLLGKPPERRWGS